MPGRSKELLARTGLTLLLLAALVLVLSRIPGYRWQWRSVWNAGTRGLMAGGLLWTLVVSLGAIGIGILLGVLAALGRMSPRLVVNHFAALYVEVVRGTPLLVQILIAWYCVQNVVRVGDRVAWGIGALGFFSGAYVAEILRAGVLAVPRGQMEAARSLGMNHRQAMLHVIGPQALKNALPPLAGQFISLVKDSSLLMVIGVGELTKRADEIQSANYSPFEMYLPLALLYLVLTLPLSRFTQHLERRLGSGVRRSRL